MAQTLFKAHPSACRGWVVYFTFMENVNITEVLQVIKDNFDFIHNQVKGRRPEEQNIIGDCLTVLELEIKKEIKKLKKV